jgi:hypothetical protein
MGLMLKQMDPVNILTPFHCNTFFLFPLKRFKDVIFSALSTDMLYANEDCMKTTKNVSQAYWCFNRNPKRAPAHY